MPTCRDIDAQIVDLLYGELDSPVEASFREHIAACDTCTALLASFAWIRELMRELPLEDAPVAVSNIVLHEASKRASPGHAAKDGESAGLWAWLTRLFQPVLAHPAAASVAALVLIATVGGVMYARSGSQLTEPVLSSKSDTSPQKRPADVAATAPDRPDPVALESAPVAREPTGLKADEERLDNRNQGEKAEYQVDLTSVEQRAKLADKGDDGEAPKGNATRSRGSRPGQFADSKRKSDADSDLLLEGLSANRSVNRSVATNGQSAPRQSPDEPVFAEAEDDNAPAPSAGAFTGSAGAGTVVGETRKVPQKVAKKRSRRAVKPASKRSAPPPPPQVPAGASSAPVASEAGKDEAKQAGGKTSWAASQHAEVRRAVSGKRCAQAARIANDIRDRDRKYYEANLRTDTTLNPCQTYIAKETTRRSRVRARAKTKRAAKKARADESAGDQAAAEAAE